jgi:hypothetical protein
MHGRLLPPDGKAHKQVYTQTLIHIHIHIHIHAHMHKVRKREHGMDFVSGMSSTSCDACHGANSITLTITEGTCLARGIPERLASLDVRGTLQGAELRDGLREGNMAEVRRTFSLSIGHPLRERRVVWGARMLIPRLVAAWR